MDLLDIPAERIASLVKEASKAILEIYGRGDISQQTKPDSSPVTEADLKADEILVNGLRALAPGVPIISEESFKSTDDALRIMRDHDLYWLVDPLDGTRDFLKRTGEFTVNVALIYEGRPIAGYVMAPTQGLLYAASETTGAFVEDASGKVREISTRPFNKKRFVALVSRMHGAGEDHELKKRHPGCEIKVAGSSLKFCQIAEGLADVYVRSGPTKLWDTAAGHCILEQAGGLIVDFGGNPLTYRDGTLVNPPFVAIGDPSQGVEGFIER